MGQRLNVEIWNNGQVLANAYYHWSAYTKSAAEIVNTAIKYIEGNPIMEDNILLYAIRTLEATGAGLTSGEIDYALTLPLLKNETFADCEGRNEGLIGISDYEIQSTRSWQEGFAHIYLDEERVSFHVFYKERRWEWEKKQKDYYGNENANAGNLFFSDVNFDDIKFSTWKNAYMFLTDWCEPIVLELDPYNVVIPIY